MTTGKALLIVGGVGVGAYVLYQLITPSSAPRRPTGGTYQTASGSIISGLVGPIFGALGNTSSPSGSNSYGGFAFGQAATPISNYHPSTPADFAAADANYGYADSHPGTALPEGVYGPPVPAPSYDADAFASSSSEYV